MIAHDTIKMIQQDLLTFGIAVFASLFILPQILQNVQG